MPGTTIRVRGQTKSFPVFGQLFFKIHRQKKLFFRARHLVVMCTRQEAHSRIFVTGGLLSGLFSYDGYYSETDRTGTVQKTIPLLKCEASMQRPPRTPMMYIPT